MLFKISTDKTVGETAVALRAAVEANHFGVMQVHNLQETMAKKGVEFARECLIFEVCEPVRAKKVLDENMSVSTALPCRISIYQERGKTILATLKPTVLLAMFNAPQLKEVARQVEDTIVNIMKEAAADSKPTCPDIPPTKIRDQDLSRYPANKNPRSGPVPISRQQKVRDRDLSRYPANRKSVIGKGK